VRILIVNPNTTASMTSSIGAAARLVAAKGTEIIAVNPPDGPSSIEGYYDEAFSVPGMLAEVRAGEKADVDGHIIACFDDSGLEAARSIAYRPVIGIGEAAFHMASLVAGRFSVVTTLSRSVPVIHLNLQKYGFAARCASVRASGIPVLDLEHDPHRADAGISAEIETAIKYDRADAIVLGCAGMANLAARMAERHGIPVLDGVACAVKLMESLMQLGLTTSKIGSYAAPNSKKYLGRYASECP
jgi:allantoin racemase